MQSDEIHERAMTTYEALQRRKAKREEKADKEATDFKITQVFKSSHKKKRGQC